MRPNGTRSHKFNSAESIILKPNWSEIFLFHWKQRARVRQSKDPCNEWTFFFHFISQNWEHINTISNSIQIQTRRQRIERVCHVHFRWWLLAIADRSRFERMCCIHIANRNFLRTSHTFPSCFNSRPRFTFSNYGFASLARMLHDHTCFECKFFSGGRLFAGFFIFY